MNVAHDRIIDQFAPSVDTGRPLATWYAPGHSDGLGDRLLMFDNTNAPSWELLRFKPSLAAHSGFTAALRERVECLRTFQRPEFPIVRPINELAEEDGLAVVSTYVSGVRLSEALKKPRSAAFALRVIQELVPAVAALQRHAPGVSHGIIDVDRIVMTPEGRLMVREHMLGSALDSLDLSPARLWAQFGILASPWCTTGQTIDAGSDVTQLALVAVSLMCGRRIGPDEYPQTLPELLDGIARRCSGPALLMFEPFRQWLERALRLAEPHFDSAQDADEALTALRLHADRGGDYFGSFDPALTDGEQPGVALEHVDRDRADRPHLVVSNPPVPSERLIVSAPAVDLDADAARQMDDAPQAVPVVTARHGLRNGMRWAAVAAVVLAAGEGIYIGRLLYARTSAPTSAENAVVIESADAGARVLVDDRPAGAAPLQLKVGSGARIRIIPPAQTAAAPQPSAAPNVAAATKPAIELARASATPAATPAPRSGGFRVVSSIPVHVLDGDRVLGSSADGPIIASAGRHAFEFVNAEFGYRARETVEIRTGQIGVLKINIPNGSVNVNAVPWATVSIDGTSFGETPIGNLSIPAGEHDVVFRHPQLGERREKIIVRADGPTRVSANLQR